MSHKILMLLALIGPILLVAAGVIAHVWDWRRDRPRTVNGESKVPTSGRKLNLNSPSTK